MDVLPAPGRVRQKDHKFKTSLCYIDETEKDRHTCGRYIMYEKVALKLFYSKYFQLYSNKKHDKISLINSSIHFFFMCVCVSAYTYTCLQKSENDGPMSV